MAVFTGAGVAIATPFHADGSVNYEEFRKLINYQVENGTDAIIVMGTTGEASTLSHEEHIEAIRFCVEVVNKRIPVVAGTGSNCTETAIYLSQEAEKAGADAVLTVTALKGTVVIAIGSLVKFNAQFDYLVDILRRLSYQHFGGIGVVLEAACDKSIFLVKCG